VSAECACTGAGRNLRPCLEHFATLPPDQRNRILLRLGLINPRSTKRS
jgi:hypothetical protein